MTREIFRFELGYQSSRTATRVYFAIFFVFVLLVNYVIYRDARIDGYVFNSPIVIALITVIASMLSLLVTAGLAGDAATRDTQLRIDSLLFTTPLRRMSWLAGRVLGAFVVSALLLAAVPLAMTAATLVPGATAGPFRLAGYLTPYFVLALSNAFVATAVLFAIALFTRRAIAAYAGAGALFVATSVARGFIATHLGQWKLAALLDPLGFTGLMALWKTYTPAQKNTRLVEIDGTLLANRFLWITFAVALLAIALLRFRLAYASTTGKRGDDAPTTRWAAITIPHARRSFGLSARMHQLFAIAMDSLRDLHKSRGWWLVPFTAILFIATAREVLEVELGTPGAVTTARIAAMFGGDELTRIVAILIAVSAGELVWRERNARINAIADVTPIPEWVAFLGRFLALGLLLITTELIFLGATVITQLMLHGEPMQLDVAIEFLFGFQLTNYVFFAALAMAIHVVVNQKYVANVVGVLAFFGVQMAREVGIEHNLLLYGSAPEPAYTEMAGFGGQVGPWLWFMLYWAGWALLLAVVSYLFWRRGEERGVRQRLTTRTMTMAIIALTIITGVGGYVFYNTNVLNHYRTSADVEQRGVEYEQRYGEYATLAQPTLAATQLQVEFYPGRRAATIRGAYTLQNRTGHPIDSIHVLCNPDVATKNVVFDRASRLASNDEDFGYRIYQLGRAIQPGESMRMQFEIVHAPRGFTNRGWNPSVAANGSWFQHRAEQDHGPRQWLPFVGYQRSREARHDDPKLEDLAARNRTMGREQIMLDTIIGTGLDQTGVAPGQLVRTWTANGRRYFHYVTDAPITNVYAVYSARYAVEHAKWNDVDIEVLHHPGHTRNLDRMVRSVRASLDYDTRNYGPYPHKQLRLVQYPSTGGSLGLSSYPGLIEYSDGYALARPDEEPRKIDLPFAVMAHEVAHQWWGHQLVPAPVEGAPLLTESLAWYSGMLVVEKSLGADHLERLLDAMRAEYITPHRTREVPLLRMNDHLDAYRTGPFALYATRRAIGEDRVNAVLRHLLSRFDAARPPYPTSLDLYEELRAVTPRDKQPLLEKLFESNQVEDAL